MLKTISFFLIITVSLLSNAQQDNTLFGFQYKPIVPNTFIGEYSRNFDSLPVFESSSQQKMGHSFGAVVRHYFLENVAFETGINFTRRNFDIKYKINSTNLKVTDNTSVSFINYQIPLSTLIFIRLSDELYMNAAIGLNLDFFPSRIGTTQTIDINNQFVVIGERLSWIQLGANANFGFEYRTRKKGIFYTGFTYNQPFTNSMYFKMKWLKNTSTLIVADYIKGSFLTIDFRYYLPSN